MKLKNTPQTTASKKVHRETLITYDEEASLLMEDGERKKLVSGILALKNNTYDNESVLVYVPVFSKNGTTTKIISTQDFLSTLETRVPAPLFRSFDSGFMFGYTRGVNDGQLHPFMLLKSNSFNQLYSGMLEWENGIADDIGDLFFSRKDLAEEKIIATSTPASNIAIVSSTTTNDSTGTSSTSTSSSVVGDEYNFVSNYILANSLVFKDEVIKNRDVRSLRTKDGRVLMYYAFINDKILLIAKDFSTIDEVTKRLASSQFRQ